MTTLIVDNYDSFTFNLVQMVAELGGAPIVHRNDALSLDDVRALAPTRVILSPGPGHPTDARAVGVGLAILHELDVPVLGVCLGHQLIGHAFGARVVRTAPMHGRPSDVTHDGSSLFAGVPRTFSAMRYHSLAVDEATLPPGLVVTARTGEIVMGVRHASRPILGVQFHPESIGTPDGARIVGNFLALKYGVDRRS